MRNRSILVLLLATASLGLPACGGASNPSSSGDTGGASQTTAQIPPTTQHFEDADLQAHLPQLTEFAANDFTPDDPSAEDFSGPPADLSLCGPKTAAGLEHSAKVTATSTAGSTGYFKAALLDFATSDAAAAYVAAAKATPKCVSAAKSQGLPLAPIALRGSCDSAAASSLYQPPSGSDDGGSSASMICRRGNVAVGLAFNLNGTTHPGPFETSGLQSYYDVLLQHLTQLLTSGRAAP